MSNGVVVDFNRLPRTTRERIIDSLGSEPQLAPFFVDRASKVKPLFWWSVLGLYGLISFINVTLRDFGQVEPGTEAVHGPWLLPLYLVPALFLTAAVLGVAFHLKRRAALPFPPGRYLFPLDFIDARSRHLRIVSLSELEDVKVVHHHTNGAYTHTAFTFFFGGRDREEFIVRNQDEAEERMQKLRQARATFGKALERQDADTVHRLDLFFDVRARGGFESLKESTSTWQEEGLVARDMPRVLQRRLLTTLAVGLVLATSTWLVRNLLSDDLAFNTAKDRGLESHFRDYLRTGWRHVDEAKELGWKTGFAECEQKDTTRCWRDHARNWKESPRLQEVRVERMPRAALKEAANTVSALRQFRKDYRASVVDEEAKARIHQLFTDSFTDFQAQASTRDPQLIPFVGKLLAHIEATENPKVLVRFRREASSSLQTADKRVGRAGLKEGRLAAAVSPHFTDDERIIPLENNIVEAMGAAFEEIFPTDLLVLEKGPALSAEKDTSSESLPVLGIHYKVGWSGKTYSSSRDSRLFVGIVFEFNVAMSLPNEKPLNFRLTVKPPDRFNVEYSRYVRRGGADEDLSGGPTSETVYSVMALRAFDELDDKLRNTFFRPTSKAFMARQDD